MMKVSVAQAKAHLSEILQRVETGQEVVITRRAIPVARIVTIERAKRPLERARRSLDLGAIDAFRGSVTPATERSADLVCRMREASY